MIDIPVIDMCKTGQNIVHYRKQQGKSIPTVDNLIILSALFKVPIEDIIAIQKKI